MAKDPNKVDPIAIHTALFETPRPFLPKMPDPPAMSAYKRIKSMIREFEMQLDSNHELGICVVGGPGNEAIHVTRIGYWGADLIRFFGCFPDGRPIQIIQNVNQINVMLMAVSKIGAEAIRIADGLADAED